MPKGNNQTKITISLKKDEREALTREAERQGIPLCTLCAALVRKHIKKRYAVTDRQTRPADNHGGGKKKIAKASK